jgi:hypothetical protein
MTSAACVYYPASAKNHEHQQSRFGFGGQHLPRIPFLPEDKLRED